MFALSEVKTIRISKPLSMQMGSYDSRRTVSHLQGGFTQRDDLSNLMKLSCLAFRAILLFSNILLHTLGRSIMHSSQDNKHSLL